MSQRVMVTGATTAVGTRLVECLAAHPDIDHVLAVGIESGQRSGITESESVTYAQIDLTRHRSMWRLLFGLAIDLQIDTVVHTATHRSPRNKGRRAHLLNVDTTLALLDMCQRQPNIRHFVYRSFAEVYAVDSRHPDVMDERHALNLEPNAPQWVRDRVEADLSICARMGLNDTMRIAVLRCAECLAEGGGSQLHDYLQSDFCFMPAGFDSMVNLLCVSDLVDAICRVTLHKEAAGVFNIPGKDTLPLSLLIKKAGRRRVEVPGPLMGPLYWARGMVRNTEFDYSVNRWRFHYNGILDGTRAQRVLDYTPQTSAVDLIAQELAVGEESTPNG